MYIYNILKHTMIHTIIILFTPHLWPTADESFPKAWDTAPPGRGAGRDCRG